MYWNVRCLLMLGALGLSLTIGCSRKSDTGRADAGQSTESHGSGLSSDTGSAAEATGVRPSEQPDIGHGDADQPVANSSSAESRDAAADLFPKSPAESVKDGAAQSEQARDHDTDDPHAEAVVTAAKSQSASNDDAHPLDNGRDGGDVLPSKSTPVAQQDQAPANSAASTTSASPVELHPPANDGQAKQPAVSNAKGSTPPPPAAAELPAQFRELDKDKDGQLGVYEWPRDDLETFQKLDRNSDGFLTTAELN